MAEKSMINDGTVKTLCPEVLSTGINTIESPDNPQSRL